MVQRQHKNSNWFGHVVIFTVCTGFCVAHTVNEVYVPSKFDLETGEVHNSMHEVHYFRYACHLKKALCSSEDVSVSMQTSEVQHCLQAHNLQYITCHLYSTV